MSNLLHIEWKAQFQTEVLDYNWIVLIDFYADRCGPCRMLAPIMEELQSENADKNVKVVKVNVDTNPELSWEFGISGIPAIFVIKNWEIVKNMVWVQHKSAYQEVIDENL